MRENRAPVAGGGSSGLAPRPLAEGQVGWQLYRIWYETESVHESPDYQTPRQCLIIGAGIGAAIRKVAARVGTHPKGK